MNHRSHESGFSFIEVMLVVSVMGIVAAIALPSTAASMRAARLKGDAQSVNNLVAQAKMRAAARSTRARVRVDLAQNQYVLEVWDRTDLAWEADSKVSRLSHGVTFGFNGLGTPPPDTQPAIAFSPECRDGVTAASATIANNRCVTFNSRGVPVADNGAPFGQNALYLTDGTAVYATTVTTTPLVRFWWTKGSAAEWVKR